ncbi:MAG: GHMP kinase [Candidatus Lokiarchaeota archaeon]|nr:GHMP kinase [Candidatus Lokiarchaeota archaeon]MBD3342192.1 GHMP kinase [Candidatus Lokiarchaeota archaeon]
MICIRAPGRICLFGEHQDYLNYNCIAMAISKYIFLKAEMIPQRKFSINLPDLDKSLEIPLNNKELNYQSRRDYLKSGYNQFVRKGITFKEGYNIEITGNIPINAGAASSSALVIAWLYFLKKMSGETIHKKELANLGYYTEVNEFGEAGGKMDFFTSSFGNIILIRPRNLTNPIQQFPIKLNGFVLGDSCEKKDTVRDLIRVKSLSMKAFEELKNLNPKFNQYSSPLEDIKSYLPILKQEHQSKIIGNILNRDITNKAHKLISQYIDKLKINSLNSKIIDHFYKELGNLLNEHQNQLKIHIGCSTQKIDNMISKALDAGALGAKINGSGFGGTMFALAPGNQENVKKAIEDAGGKAYIITTSDGVSEY